MTELNSSEDLSEEISTIDSLRELAIDHGFAYRDADSSLIDRWGTPPFSGFGHRRALDVVTTEQEGFPVVAFRFMIGELARTAGAESLHGGGLRLNLPEVVDGYLVVAAALPSPLPRFALAPQDGAVDEVPYGHGFEPEDDDLAERYDVYAAEPDTAAAVLHLDAVAKIREHRTVDWRVEGRDVLVVDPLGDEERSVEDILATVEAVVTIAKGIGNEAYARFKAPSAYPPPA